MAKKILVTGGTGFIGAGLVKRLLKSGHHVRVLDNHWRGSVRRLGDFQKDVELVEADIRDAAAVKKAVHGMDQVAHLAYVNGTEYFYKEPELVLDVAIRGMMSIIDACRSEGVKDLIVASSSEVYQTPPVTPTDESAPISIPDILNPRYSYGGGKILCELITINYGRKGFDRATLFRPHNVYGPDMGFEHVIPQMVSRAFDQVKSHPTGKVPFEIMGTGEQTRAFVYIDDCADGIAQMMEKGEHLGIYHIGNPEEVTMAALAHMIFNEMGRECELKSIPDAVGSTQRRSPDITKLKKLGYDPKISLKEGLKPTVRWYLENQNLRKK